MSGNNNEIKLVGRTEYLRVLNKVISSDYIKLSELSDGIGFLRLMNKIYKFQDNKNFKYKKICNNDEDKLTNLELLDHLISDIYKLRIKPRLPINNIIRGQFKAIFDTLKFIIDYLINERPDLYYISENISQLNDPEQLFHNTKNNNKNNNHNNRYNENIANKNFNSNVMNSDDSTNNDPIYTLIEQVEMNLDQRIKRCQYKLKEISRLKESRDSLYKSLNDIEELCNQFRSVFENSNEILSILYDQQT